jgi:hypothetical protein
VVTVGAMKGEVVVWRGEGSIPQVLQIWLQRDLQLKLVQCLQLSCSVRVGVEHPLVLRLDVFWMVEMLQLGCRVEVVQHVRGRLKARALACCERHCQRGAQSRALDPAVERNQARRFAWYVCHR